MTTEQEIKKSIRQKILTFDSDKLYESSVSLLNSFGYKSNKIFKLTPPNVEGFSTFFDLSVNNFNREKACLQEWEKVDVIFQLTGEELSDQENMFSIGQIDNKIIESFLFIAIRLKHSDYTRSLLARITREVNKLTSMPSMIIFCYDDYLTLSVIDRRLNKKDSAKDVLEKVTLIKDINLSDPHRAHVEILYDLSLERIKHQYKVTNFVELHDAWRKTLDISELNKKFYKNIANWYFWAIKNVKFPLDNKLSADSVNNSINVIRLLTRLIFVWFLKEKNLVPDSLFNPGEIKNIVNSAADKNKSAYFKAILQNLFFATLNTEMNKDKPGNRRFVKDEENYLKQRNEYGIKTLFRYSDLFKLSQKDAVKLFDDIPFLNGGLFDCLDKEDEEGKVIYVDGFTRNDKLQPVVPDFLFFGHYPDIDLSEDFGDKKRKHEDVDGLIDILKAYKFTVTENTPIEEEVALDPELLGKVFENLLASYNPETQTTARKQTGSFYTPREIVNYMVDESLIAYLKNKLLEGSDSYVKLGDNQTDFFGNKERKGQLKIEEDLAPKAWAEKVEKLEDELRNLLAYTEKSHNFSPDEAELLISAIENVKILDPACGSGAFPMGVLHKLVHILHKLDSHNEQWKQKQIKAAEQTPDPILREQQLKLIEDSFNLESNYSDYGRKLYLIQRCIFGVDIQPIAVQISKLRFFISLLIDQKDNPEKPNRGVLSLPNLETKFVAANTLIGLDKPDSLDFRNEEIKKLEDELKTNRNLYFNAKNRTAKRKYRGQDKIIRQSISSLIKDEFDSYSKAIKTELDILNKSINHESIKTIKEVDKKKYEKARVETEKKIEKLTKYLESEATVDEIADKISSFDIYDQNSSASWFDSEWMFNVNEKFDVVIGNPPYGIEFTFKEKEYLKVRYEYLIQRIRNSYLYFIGIANDFIKSGGVFTYIIPNEFLFQIYMEKARKYFLNNTQFKIAINTGERVFEAIVPSCVILITKKKVEDYKISLKDLREKNLNELREELSTKDFITIPSSQIIESPNAIFSFNNNKNSIINAIISRSKVFEGFCEDVANGISTSCDKVYIIKTELAKSLEFEKKYLKPSIRGSHFNKFFCPAQTGEYVLYITSDFEKSEAPNIYNYLKKNKQFLIQKSVEKRDGIRDWHLLFRPRSKDLFKSPKIIIRQTGDRIIAAIDRNRDYYCIDSVNVVRLHSRFNKIARFFIGLLNSKLFTFYYQEISQESGRVLAQVKPQRIKRMPIIETSFSQLFEKCVLFIEFLKSNNSTNVFFEILLDSMIYELYFPEEIKSANCNIIKYLIDLPELKEDWINDKKIRTIEKVYKELSNPKHPVSIAMQKMQEIEEVKIIEGKI